MMTKTVQSVLRLAIIIASVTRTALAAPVPVYVEAGYSGNELGTQSSPFNTIQEAVDFAGGPFLAASDVEIFVKAGFYGEEVDISRDNIAIVGYNMSVGDLDNGEGMPDDYDDIPNHFSDQPVIFGATRDSGAGFTATGKFGVVVKNFTVYNFRKGIAFSNVDSTPVESRIENVFAFDLGSLDEDPEEFDYSGDGIELFACIGVVVNRCIVLNSAAEGFIIASGHSNTVSNCLALCDDNSGPVRNIVSAIRIC